MNATVTPQKLPVWLIAIAVAGLAWNMFGIVQFVGTLRQTQDSLMMGGMTADQARVYYGLPGWTKLAFALGVGGGLLGSVGLLLRRAVAGPILLISLLAYIVLWFADLGYGVFAVLQNQLAILSFVVAVAVVLYATARAAKSRGVLA